LTNKLRDVGVEQYLLLAIDLRLGLLQLVVGLMLVGVGFLLGCSYALILLTLGPPVLGRPEVAGLVYCAAFPTTVLHWHSTASAR
jgi:hypothetical protein